MTDENNTSVSFTTVKISDETLNNTQSQVLYLKFTVNGNGTKKYVVTVTGTNYESSYPISVNLWQPVQ